jgi:hypothetical protein
VFRDHLPTAGMPMPELEWRLQRDRAEKDAYFRSSAHSPVEPERRAAQRTGLGGPWRIPTAALRG